MYVGHAQRVGVASEQTLHRRSDLDSVGGEPAQVLDVVEPAGGQVVDDAHLVTLLQEQFTQVAPDETATTGDEDRR